MTRFRTQLVLRAIARVALVGMLHGQIAVAAVPCVQPNAKPSQAIMAQAAAPDCGMGEAAGSAMCLTHCLSADQAVGGVDFHFAAVLPSTPAFHLELFSPDRAGAFDRLPPDFGGPPLRILHCCLRN